MTFSCSEEMDLANCDELVHAYKVEVSQYYSGSWMYWTDYYVDGFGIVEMISAGRHMVLDCDVSLESESWDAVKAMYR